MKTFFAIAVGGALGSIPRYGPDNFVASGSSRLALAGPYGGMLMVRNIS